MLPSFEKGPLLDILFMIFSAVVAIGFIVLIHEGGHYLASRAFGVRVTEFMLGLPGPSVGFTAHGTRFGVTAVPLGGYARVCGMEAGDVHPHARGALREVYQAGSLTEQELSGRLGISEDEAYEALDQLAEWGSVLRPGRKDAVQAWKTPALAPSRRVCREAVRLGMPAPVQQEAGSPRQIADPDAFFERELACQYRSLPFWKRSVILLAGIGVNLLFAVIAFIVVYSVIGVDYVNAQTGEAQHLTLSVWQSIQAGFGAIVVTFQAILGLFNPATAADTVSNSTSVIGIAVMSADFFAKGVADALFFMAVISISIGLMNLLPIPPLDGGRFLVEIIQKLTRRTVPARVMGALSMAGMALFLCFFAFMLNQDVQRFILG